jgi:hypothetical protein
MANIFMQLGFEYPSSYLRYNVIICFLAHNVVVFWLFLYELEKPKVFGNLNGTLYFQNGTWLLLSNYNLGFQGVFGSVYCPLFKLLVVEGETHDFFCS